MRTLAPAVGLAVLVAVVAAVSYSRRAQPPEKGLLPHQARVSELPAAEQARHDAIRAALEGAEQVRSDTKQWPPVLAVPGFTWTQKRHGIYVNYVGVPAEGLRWLVLYVEPEPAPIQDPVPPEDDEHHTLPDGTGLHVTLWTAPNAGPVPEAALPFPAAEGWTQRLR